MLHGESVSSFDHKCKYNLARMGALWLSKFEAVQNVLVFGRHRQLAKLPHHFEYSLKSDAAIMCLLDIHITKSFFTSSRRTSRTQKALCWR